MHNETLKLFYGHIGSIKGQYKERVKKIMGWSADAAFYDRIYGRVTCTPAEQDAFTKAANEIIFTVPTDLFPEGQAKKIIPVE